MEFRYTTTNNLLHEKMGFQKGKHWRHTIIWFWEACRNEYRDQLIFKYNKTTDHNKNLLVNTATQCPRIIKDGKEKNIFQSSAQLEDPKTAQKTT